MNLIYLELNPEIPFSSFPPSLQLSKCSELRFSSPSSAIAPRHARLNNFVDCSLVFSVSLPLSPDLLHSALSSKLRDLFVPEKTASLICRSVNKLTWCKNKIRKSRVYKAWARHLHAIQRSNMTVRYPASACLQSCNAATVKDTGRRWVLFP